MSSLGLIFTLYEAFSWRPTTLTPRSNELELDKDRKEQV